MSNRIIIRLMDIVLSLSAVLILSPVFLLVAVAIKIDSPGPIIFKQKRLGKDNKPFTLYKFRSMSQDASSKGKYYTSVGDSRITKVGAFIRKTSIDELPQLFNILFNDMSLVGPRPLVEQQVALYTEEQLKQRALAVPGLTGLAQITDRHNIEFAERLRLDIEYVADRTVARYVTIIFKTAAMLFKAESY